MKNTEQYNEVIKDYSYLVEKIAKYVTLKIPKALPYDDLVQAGMLGLIEAYQKFDVEKGASFVTYAGIRIRGAMIDEIRKDDWTPRSVYRKSRELFDQVIELEHILGRPSSDRERADYLNIDLFEYRKLVGSIKTNVFFNYEESVGCEELIISYFMGDNNPASSAHVAKVLEKVAQEIKSLPQDEFKVFSLYYDNEMSLREIGQLLGLSESRVSQIRSKVLIRLQNRILN